MSKEGRLRRGKQYYMMRDVNGNYPEGITSNKNKMEELQEYLDTLPTPVVEDISKKKKKGE